MADTIENDDITPQSAAEAKMTSSGADFVADTDAAHTTNVSGEVIDGVSGAGLVTDADTDSTPDWAKDTTPEPAPADSAPSAPAPTEPLPTVTEIKDQAVQKGQEALAQGKQAATQALEQGKEAAGQALGQAKDQIVTELGSRKDTLAQTLEGAVTALHSTSQQFRDQNIPYVGEYADTFASQVQKASEYIKGKDITELARDAERVARENPIAFVGGAFVLGLALARFLKSSSEGSPLAFVQGATGSDSTALVPTNGSATDAGDKVEDVFGERPLSAHGYVAGVGSIGDN